MTVGVADSEVFAAARKRGMLMPYAAHNPSFIVGLKAIPVGKKIATVAILAMPADPQSE